MTAIIKTNSAQHLQKILTQLHDVRAQPEQRLTQVLIKFFEEEELNDDFAICYGALLKAFQKVREDIDNCSQISDNSKILFKNTIELLSGVTKPQNFNQIWKVIKNNHLLPTTIEQLHPISDFFDQHYPLHRISEEEISDIRKQAEELRNSIENNEGINSDLKLIILSHLDDIIKAINLYKAFGDTLFQAKAKEALGDLISNPIYRHSDDAKPYIGLLGRCFDSISKTYTASSKLVGSGENVVKLVEFFDKFTDN